MTSLVDNESFFEIINRLRNKIDSVKVNRQAGTCRGQHGEHECFVALQKGTHGPWIVRWINTPNVTWKECKMSQVPSYVGAVDGKFYRNPTLFGEHEGHWWFICWDDEDPAELVVQDGTDEFARRLLKALNISTRCLVPARAGARRFANDNHKRSRPAVSYWIELTEPIPVPVRHDGVWRGRCEAVFFPYGLEIPR